MRKIEVNRKLYEKVRKMDHNTLSQYIDGVYQQGYTDGATNAKGLTNEELKSVLMSIKGIGEVKAESIASTIVEAEKEKGGR